MLSFNNSKWEKKEQKIIENEMEKLVTKSNRDFLKLIDEISTKSYFPKSFVLLQSNG